MDKGSRLLRSEVVSAHRGLLRQQTQETQPWVPVVVDRAIQYPEARELSVREVPVGQATLFSPMHRVVVVVQEVRVAMVFRRAQRTPEQEVAMVATESTQAFRGLRHRTAAVVVVVSTG